MKRRGSSSRSRWIPRTWRWTNRFARRYRGGLSVVAGVIALGVIWVFVHNVVEPESSQDRTAALRLVAEIAAGGALAATVYVGWRRVSVAQDSQTAIEQGQITDRFAKAVEQLGDQNLHVRLGGIYALERIARDSPRDHWPVLEVLSAFATHPPAEDAPALIPATPERPWKTPPLLYPDRVCRVDVAAVFRVIGRRTDISGHEGLTGLSPIHAASVHETRALRLQGVVAGRVAVPNANLEFADFDSAYLERANLSEAHLERSNFSEARLERADLSHAHLEYSYFQETQLAHTNFEGAELKTTMFRQVQAQGANFRNSGLERTFFLECHLENAMFEGANLSDADFDRTTLEGAHMDGANLSGTQWKDTVCPDGTNSDDHGATCEGHLEPTADD